MSIVDKFKSKLSSIRLGSSEFDFVDIDRSSYDKEFSQVMNKIANSNNLKVCIKDIDRSDLEAIRYRAKKNGFNIHTTTRIPDVGGNSACIEIGEDNADSFEEFLKEELG